MKYIDILFLFLYFIRLVSFFSKDLRREFIFDIDEVNNLYEGVMELDVVMVGGCFGFIFFFGKFFRNK